MNDGSVDIDTGMDQTRTPLGTAFVVDGPRAIFITAAHVFSSARGTPTVWLLSQASPQKMRVAEVDASSMRRWSDHDLVAFQALDRNGRPLDGLRALPRVTTPLGLGADVMAIGFAPDHFHNSVMAASSSTKVLIRALRCGVATYSPIDAEVPLPFVGGMSGGPVILANSENVVGLAYGTRVVPLEPITPDVAAESASYGIFYLASAFGPWLEQLLVDGTWRR